MNRHSLLKLLGFVPRPYCGVVQALPSPQHTVRFVVAALIGLSTILPLALPALAQDDELCARDVVVRSGETLSAIAARELGSTGAYPQIVAATNAAAANDERYAVITDPSVIAIGWRLCLPTSNSSDAAQAPAIALAPQAEPADSTSPGEEEILFADPEQLTIDYLRSLDFPGSDLLIEQELTPGDNYARYVASYRSEGLKILGLLTVPSGEPPQDGWPAIVFNHGYIPPAVYRTTERYVAYQDGFARAGYVTFKPDYRGHGFSEGESRSAYGFPDYTVDVLNATSSVKQLPSVDAQRIGMWGHSMGGYITLRAMLVDDDVKVGVIWAGVVASYPDLLERWTRRGSYANIPARARRWRQQIIDTVGGPAENPEYWASISANTYVDELSGPIQLHHGSDDASVPLLFSELLYEEIQSAGGAAELHVYSGDDHNLSRGFNTAMARSVAQFDAVLK